MKKWLTFLLLLVTITATLYPCCGKDDCCNNELTSKTTNHKHKEGTCSPFITCGTCAGFTQVTNTVIVPIAPEEKTVHHSKVICLTLSSYTPSLLQPPQVA